MIIDSTNIALAVAVRDLLESRNWKLVLAESCTAGQIAATLGCVPGISNWLCGSFVVYRCDSKAAWLEIPLDILNNHELGPVSPVTSKLLAESALQHTPAANCSLAITGDVGPNAPQRTDGLCFVAIQLPGKKLIEAQIKLAQAAPKDAADIDARSARLREATGRALELLLRSLSEQ
jgi:nicotinamide-nucleotide amidase